MDWSTFVMAKAILFLLSIGIFLAYNFWELHRDSQEPDAPPEEDPNGQISEAPDDESDA